MIFRKTRLLRWDGPLPENGDYLKTPSGSFYAVLSFKPNMRHNPKSVGSMNLLKLSEDDINTIPDSARIHNFKWTSR